MPAPSQLVGSPPADTHQPSRGPTSEHTVPRSIADWSEDEEGPPSATGQAAAHIGKQARGHEGDTDGSQVRLHHPLPISQQAPGHLLLGSEEDGLMQLARLEGISQLSPPQRQQQQQQQQQLQQQLHSDGQQQQGYQHQQVQHDAQQQQQQQQEQPPLPVGKILLARVQEAFANEGESVPAWMQHMCRQVPDSLWFATNSETIVHDPCWPKASLRVDLRPASIAAAAAAATARHSTGPAPGVTNDAERPASIAATAAAATATAARESAGPARRGTASAERPAAQNHTSIANSTRLVSQPGPVPGAGAMPAGGAAAPATANVAAARDAVAGVEHQQQQQLLCSEHLGLLLRALLQLRFTEPADTALPNSPSAAPTAGIQPARSASGGGGAASRGSGAGGGTGSMGGRVQGGVPATDNRAEGNDGRCERKTCTRLVVPLESFVLHDRHSFNGSGSDARGGAGPHAPTAAAAAAAVAVGQQQAQSSGVHIVDGAGSAVEGVGGPVVTDGLLDNELLWRLTQLSGSTRLRHLELCHCASLTVYALADLALCAPLTRTLQVLRLSHNPCLRWKAQEESLADQQQGQQYQHQQMNQLGQQQQTQQQQQRQQSDPGPSFWKMLLRNFTQLVCLDLRHIGEFGSTLVNGL
ncbi:hypothetical protein DUNSADRAFT_18184 [Dunaliella salina]|uniref:Uncharacterized protein n=1 Tax=Dunaliella salina TaxID=3046 RepID=A0ABQ7G0J2_DUNSA|nr:hypothetical protein DUNSADRAFT_18184 [Dunaliella salina]KAF5828114.1 hypothetical protein DUNSADRAFT_18184 [Dunaliella salina]|eukprot:KAF5828113.1 hypothetical protein DUNSADRAFT_18184 [Dunaliella salina]